MNPLGMWGAMRILDISLPLSESIVTWEGQPRVRLTHVRHLASGDHATVGHVSMTLHTGTHVDAPSHHILGGASAADLALSTMVGPAIVVDLQEAASISAAELDRLDIPVGAERILFRTRNSKLWDDPAHTFRRDYVGITEQGARWLVERDVRLVGTDYLSVVAWDDLVPAHRVFLAAGVVLLEGLDLRAVAPRSYTLVCLPLRLVDGDGAPARALLIDE